MGDVFLAIVDTVQIQSYIFNSNRLQENVGASHCVALATKEWVCETLDALKLRKDISAPEAGFEAEVVLTGGGNAIILFSQESDVLRFERQLSKRVLCDAPGLQLFIHHHKFDWQNDSFSEALRYTFAILAKHKAQRALSTPLLGLGVTRVCNSTGLPAVEKTDTMGDDDGYYASAEIFAKIAMARTNGRQGSNADRRLKELLPPSDGYAYPSQFDDLGRSSGEHSYIAVVHADGDGMAKWSSRIRKSFSSPEKNRDCVDALHEFSTVVNKSAVSSLRMTISDLMSRIEPEGVIKEDAAQSKKKATQVELKKNQEDQWLLPFRPIVFGGDDVTFVCDGRLGISMAVSYIKHFKKISAQQLAASRFFGKLQNVKEKNFTASAGVAIVKAHYPFARAYRLAEELCESAKDYRKGVGDGSSCLDWHMAAGGLSGGLKEMREREYETKSGRLTLRPVTIGENQKDPLRSWTIVFDGICGFRSAAWLEKHNKIKALRDALRDGGSAVERFRKLFLENTNLPHLLEGRQDLETKGWHGGLCGYFDAIELVDWFISVDAEGAKMP